ncbi:MAG: Txe/YoeB family addiction module toxin [Bacteroidia bacterium]|nr:Txe/YoeB family addiction module toxin [Bacteroidia bacterium]
MICFTENAWDDYQYWQELGSEKLERINLLIKAISRDSYKGIGKPEPLKGNLSGWWSRRIDMEHRIVYKIENKNIIILQCRYHY